MSSFSMWPGHKRPKGVEKLISHGPEEYSEGRFKLPISHSKYCSTALSVSGFRVCAHQLMEKNVVFPVWPEPGKAVVWQLSSTVTACEEWQESLCLALFCSPMLHFWVADICEYFTMAGRGLCVHVGEPAARTGELVFLFKYQIDVWIFFPRFLFFQLMSNVFSKCLETVFLSQIGIATASEQNSKASA